VKNKTFRDKPSPWAALMNPATAEDLKTDNVLGVFFINWDHAG